MNLIKEDMAIQHLWNYLDLQSPQNDSPHTPHFGIEAILLCILEVEVGPCKAREIQSILSILGSFSGAGIDVGSYSGPY